MTDDPMRAAERALDDADETVRRLHAACCEPGRSPAMEALAADLVLARERLHSVAVDAGTADDLISGLEEAGARVGHLQVGCCAPGRLPLYARLLEDLTKVQLTVNRHLGRSH
ncbi:MAG TPA: hypothetical protein VLB85_06625 [Acidimicrobiia bacterium]|nr:hypothetical protein [Acidimicrobiia bacterium]